MQDAQVWRRQVQGLARTLGRLEERLQSQVALAADLAQKNAQLAQREDHCRQLNGPLHRRRLHWPKAGEGWPSSWPAGRGG